MNQSPTAAQPDVSQLASANLPAASFPGGRQPAYRIYFAPDLHARLWQHGSENLAVEICGVLVGTWGKDESGPFVTITESIRGEAATSKFAEVTFTHETWAKINHEMDTRFTNQSIVGWYHTHPDFGIFLSDRDVFIQQHFFSNPGNVAYVIDPVRKTEGTFTWQGGKPALAPHYWVGDKVQIAGAATCLETKSQPAGPAGSTAPTPTSPASSQPASDWTPRLRLLSQILCYMCLFLLGYLIASRFNDLDRSRLEQDAFARATLLVGVKPGLGEALERCQNDLSGLAKEAESLAKDHQKSASDGLTDQQKEQWQSLRSGLVENRRRLGQLRSVYSLTPAETQRMLQMAADILSSGSSARQQHQLRENLEKLFRQLMPEDAPKDKETKDKEAKDNDAKDKEVKK